MEKQNILNKNDNINLEDQQIIEQIDEYNINQLLMNIFKRLLIKAEANKSEKNDNSSLLSILITRTQ